MRLSSIGLIGGALLAGAVSASPAFADASISGSATFITPAGFTSTLSAETVAPANTAFITSGASALSPAVASVLPATPGSSATLTNSLAIVVPATQLLGFSVSLTSLSLGTTATLSPTPATSSTFSAAAAAVLIGSVDGTFPTATNNIEIISAIIKAGAGVNGLD